MNVPGFNAESSLGSSMGVYQKKAAFGGSGTSEVSMQQFGTSPLLDRFGVQMRCCGYSTLLHRFVCTTRMVSPLEHCSCQNDFFGHPLITCRPPILSRD